MSEKEAKKLFDSITNISDDLIESAQDIHGKARRKRKAWIKWGAVAACLCIAVVGAVIWQKTAAPEKTDSGTVLSENGVTVPKLEVSLSANSEAKMIAFFSYHGSCYVQYEWLDDADIIGNYLGTSTGLIDEWTPEEGYVELAGSVKGDFFSVKGYDPAFMLCMKDATGAVSTYLCNNGITLKYGSELYEDRLHLSGNYSAVQYETHDSWDYSKNELYQLKGHDEVINSLIEQLDKAEFIPWEDVPAREGMTDVSLYDTERYHLHFRMNNGTTVHLRLYENGYVRFQGLMDVCVQVPQDRFSTLIGLLDGRIDAEAVSVPNRTEAKLERCKNDPELGTYFPTYEAPETVVLAAENYYYLEPHTGMETGTKEIYAEYSGVSDPNLYYAVTVTWREEYGKNGWAGPMLDRSELSIDALAEYVKTGMTGKAAIDVGVWYDDVSVVLSANGIGAEDAYEIFRSVK